MSWYIVALVVLASLSSLLAAYFILDGMSVKDDLETAQLELRFAREAVDDIQREHEIAEAMHRITIREKAEAEKERDAAYAMLAEAQNHIRAMAQAGGFLDAPEKATFRDSGWSDHA